MSVDPLTLSHPNGDYFFTTLDQAKWRDDVFGNQFVLLKDFTGLQTINDRKNAVGELWIKTPASNIYPFDQFLSACIVKYSSKYEYYNLSGNSIKDYEIYYDTILINSNNGNVNICNVEKYNYNYDTDTTSKLNGNVISISSEYNNLHWFDESNNNLFLVTLSDTSHCLYPTVRKINISDNIIRSNTIYPKTTEYNTLQTEQITEGFVLSAYNSFQSVIHSSDNKTISIETICKKDESFDILSFDILTTGDSCSISSTLLKSLVPYSTTNLSSVDWYASALSATTSLSGTVGNEILIDISSYPHDGYGAAKIEYSFGDEETLTTTQSTYFYDTDTFLISNLYYDKDEPLKRPVKHIYTKEGVYTLLVHITNAGTLRKETLEKQIVIRPANYYNIFEDINLLGCRNTETGKVYALETVNPNYVTFLNYTNLV